MSMALNCRDVILLAGVRQEYHGISIFLRNTCSGDLHLDCLSFGDLKLYHVNYSDATWVYSLLLYTVCLTFTGSNIDVT